MAKDAAPNIAIKLAVSTPKRSSTAKIVKIIMTYRARLEKNAPRVLSIFGLDEQALRTAFFTLPEIQKPIISIRIAKIKFMP
jgi:hypothetical protein